MHIHISIYVYICICTYIYIYIYIWGERFHTRNQHLGNHCGCSVAFSTGCSVAVAAIISNSNSYNNSYD